jgi:hypothetical protein
MVCRHIRFELAQFGEGEWVPMALREATCMLRSSNPEKWNQVLRCSDIEVEGDDTHCMHNLEGTWVECPLYRERKAREAAEAAAEAEADPPEAEEDDDVPRNEHGIPLQL